MFLVDAMVRLTTGVVGRTYREAARTCEVQLGDQSAAVRESLRAFAELERAPIGAQDTGEALDAVMQTVPDGRVSATLLPKRPRLRARPCRIR